MASSKNIVKERVPQTRLFVMAWFVKECLNTRVLCWCDVFVQQSNTLWGLTVFIFVLWLWNSIKLFLPKLFRTIRSLSDCPLFTYSPIFGSRNWHFILKQMNVNGSRRYLDNKSQKLIIILNIGFRWNVLVSAALIFDKD